MKYNYIAIEREYASGGQEIGTLAAEKLGIPCYGREILEKTAQRENISVDYIEEMEEKIRKHRRKIAITIADIVKTVAAVAAAAGN